LLSTTCKFFTFAKDYIFATHLKIAIYGLDFYQFLTFHGPVENRKIETIIVAKNMDSVPFSLSFQG
jgi:hypothetical protein